MNICDECGVESKKVIAGRWIFYCPKHKQLDINHTMENEIIPDLESGNMDHIMSDGELQETLLKSL